MSKVVLRQFLLAIALVVLYYLVRSYHSYAAHPQFAERAGGLVMAFVLDLPRAVLFALPIATGVALALLPIGPGAFRQGLVLAGGVTAVLVFNDVALHDLWRAMDARSMGESLESWPRRFNDTTSAIGGTVAHLLGRVQPGDIQHWPPAPSTNPGLQTITDARVIVRMSAAMKYAGALDLSVPILLAGIVLGFGTWLHKVTTFRSPRDERLFRLALGWLLTLAVAVGLEPGGAAIYELSSPRASMAWLLVPYLVVGVPAILGWRAVRRLDHLADA